MNNLYGLFVQRAIGNSQLLHKRRLTWTLKPLDQAFLWTATPEGYGYWWAVSRKITEFTERVKHKKELIGT